MHAPNPKAYTFIGEANRLDQRVTSSRVLSALRRSHMVRTVQEDASHNHFFCGYHPASSGCVCLPTGLTATSSAAFSSPGHSTSLQDFTLQILDKALRVIEDLNTEIEAHGTGETEGQRAD